MALQLSHSPSRTLPSPSSASHDSASKSSSRLQSPNQSEKSTPSKRKISFSTHQKPRLTGGMSWPLPPESRSEGKPSLDDPQTPDGQRHSLAKRAKSASERTVEAETGAFNDDPIPTPDLRRRPYTSPCGKKSYMRHGNLTNHQRSCEACEGAMWRESEMQETHTKESDLSLPMARDDSDDQGIEATEDLTKVPGGTMSVDMYHVAESESEPDNEFRSRPSAQEVSVGTLNAAKDSSYTGSVSPTEEPVSTETRATDSFVIRAERGETPLGLEDGIYPEGKPTVISAEPCLKGFQLHDKLKEKLEQRLTPKDQRGEIYIFSDPKRPHLLKIGRTRQTQRRLTQIQYSCGLQLELVHRLGVVSYTRTEGLIHAYLSDLCRPYFCKICGAKHGEWFEITKESAHTYVTKWGAFMSKESPYDADSKEFRPFFRNLISLRENLLKSPDIETVRRNWDQILSPTVADRFGYIIGIIWEIIWKFIWPVNAMIAWTITFVAIQHPATFILMALSVIGAFVTMAHDFHRLRYDTAMSSKRSSK